MIRLLLKVFCLLKCLNFNVDIDGWRHYRFETEICYKADMVSLDHETSKEPQNVDLFKKQILHRLINIIPFPMCSNGVVLRTWYFKMMHGRYLKYWKLLSVLLLLRSVLFSSSTYLTASSTFPTRPSKCPGASHKHPAYC